MTIVNIINFIKKKGFRDTFEVLSKFKNFTIDKHTFYNELNKISYYNSFFRVKDELINKGLLTIEKDKINKKKQISLTEKGLNIYNRLMELNDLVGNHKS
ncbi:MAG TPA: hypothetical protein VGB37_07570 [Candidatus Lokiarchaeia archaeon]